MTGRKLVIGWPGPSLTEGQLVIGTQCLGRHSMFPLTQAQRVQFTDDHMSPSCRMETQQGQNTTDGDTSIRLSVHPSIRPSFTRPSALPPVSSLLSHPVDLVPDSAVLHLLHLHVGQTLFAALVALTASRPRAPLLAHHCGILGRRRTPSSKHFIIMNRVLE